MIGYYLHRMFVVVAICHLQYRWSFKHSPQSVFGVMFSHLALLSFMTARKGTYLVENFGLDLPLLFQLHEMWSVVS